MWLSIVCVVLTILVWGIGLLLRARGVAIPIVWLVLATVAILVGALLWLLLSRLRARLAAKKLERELLAQAGRAPSDPTTELEFVELRAQLERGIRALRSSRLRATGRDALYELPWYVIVGPPGVGKTTALKHSGLSFPFEDPREQGGVRGVGGTRNCDWWFSNDAVLLDTAGRYALSDDDRPEWFAFLDLLRRRRKKKPINGVLIAVSVADLLERTEDEVASLARVLRMRIDELTDRLDMVVPVYVLFTKTDLLAGFVEFFHDLPQSERHQVFGATVDLREALSGRATEQLAPEFDALLSRLRSRLHRRLMTERSSAAKRWAFQFPLEFRALMPRAVTFVSTLLEETAVSDQPIFRGFYFTSGTQEGSPLARVLGNMAEAFGLPMARGPGGAHEPSSYFVTDVFRSVVFPEQNVAGRTRREQRRELLGRLAFAVVTLGLVLLTVTLPSCSFRQNARLLTAATEAAGAAASVDWRAVEPARNAAQVTALREQLQRLDEWAEAAPPARVRWGMYVGNAVHPAMQALFVRGIEAGLEPGAPAELSRRLRAFAEQSADVPSRYQDAYDLLKLYLMTTEPANLDPAWAAPRLARLALDALPVSKAPAKDEATLTPEVEYYLTLMKRGDVDAWTRDESVVSRARTELLRTPQVARLYDLLVREASRRAAPVRHADIFFGTVAAYVTYQDDIAVDGAYTKVGWSHVRQMLGKNAAWLTGETWVLGEGQDATREEVKTIVDQLRLLYFERYKQAWRDFFVDIVTHEPENAQTALDELTALSEPVWPYRRLIQTLAQHAKLDVAEHELSSTARSMLDTGIAIAKEKLDIGDAGVRAPRPVVSPVEQAFKPVIEFGLAAPGPDGKAPPSGLDTYQGELAKLVSVLTEMRDGEPNPDPSPLGQDFQTAYRTTSALLASQTGYTRPMLSPLLMRPISFAWGGVMRDVGTMASGRWQTEVWSEWKAKLEGRYPFEQAAADAKLADFVAFFDPGQGLLWAFYDKNLKGSLRRDGNVFTPTRRFRSAVAYSQPFLHTCMGRGGQITDTLFTAPGKPPRVDFDVNLHTVSPDVSRVTLIIDGAEAEYGNHPAQWLEAHWPAESTEDRGARVKVSGYNDLAEEIIRPGDFGFFRLLDSASSVEPGNAGGRTDGEPTLVATWELKTRHAFVSVDIRPAKGYRSLTSDLFTGYTCPRVITD